MIRNQKVVLCVCSVPTTTRPANGGSKGHIHTVMNIMDNGQWWPSVIVTSVSQSDSNQTVVAANGGREREEDDHFLPGSEHFGEEDAFATTTTIICISEIGKSIVLLHFPVHSI